MERRIQPPEWAEAIADADGPQVVVAGIIVAWRTRSVVATLIVGIVTLWILEAL